MRKITVFLILGIVALLWAFAGTYLYHGGRMQCMTTGYERFDRVSNGIKSPSHSEPADGSPDGSILLKPLIPKTTFSYNGVFNITQLVGCEDSYANTSRISYVELRSEALSSAIKSWQERTNDQTGFQKKNLHTDRVAASYNGDGRSGYRVWNPAYALKNAPEWLPKDQIGEQTFIAFWGDGHLFKGRLPDQYFWIGYRL
jgi:hypothetical protein